MGQKARAAQSIFRSVPFNRLQDSVLNDIVEDINKNYLFVGKPDKKLNILKVEVKARDELFAKSFNDQIVKNVSDYYIQTRTQKSMENVRLDSAGGKWRK